MDDLIYPICAGFLVITLLCFGGCFVEAYSQANTCKNQSLAMEFNYEYKWHFWGENICTYILPDGKRVVSTKYRVLEE